jgi:hypothetical protein
MKEKEEYFMKKLVDKQVQLNEVTAERDNFKLRIAFM